MRKQVAIGVSMLALTAMGGVSEHSVLTNLQDASPQYTHLVNVEQSLGQISQSSISIKLPNRANYQTAGVYFITGKDGVSFGDGKDNTFDDPSGENCKRLGYTVTSCASGLFNSFCPYNDKIYDRCCESTYTYTASTCSSPKTLSSDTCGGKHRCYCDTKTYPYASCNNPQIKGSACTDDSGTRYATCTCPNANNGQWGCKEYYASPCNKVCKTPYPDSCHLHESVPTPYGCEKTFEGCSSKCEVAYKDNCRNHDAVIAKCPDNATCTEFSDCSSKIQSWSCNSGYVKSGNTCIVENPCPGYEKKTACPNKYYKKEVCSKDSNYIKCTSTCGSRIVDDNPTYKVDEANYNDNVVVVTKSATYLPGGKTVYSNINFQQYAECKALPKPVITMTASRGGSASLSVNRIENIDFVVNYSSFQAPVYCSSAYSFRNSPFCTGSPSSYYDCNYRSNCMSNANCRNSNLTCKTYYDAMEDYGADLCNVAQSYDSYCTAPNPSVGLVISPSKDNGTSTYSCNNRSSTKYHWEGTLKNVNITVNGNPSIAVAIGGGAHYEKTLKFEGTNKITGGSKHSVWVRGHNTCAYGIVKGILQVNSGASLTLSKPACIYTAWNGVVNRYGTISGTVTTGCTSYKLSW